MTTLEQDALAAQRPSPASDGFIPADADNITIFPEQVTDNLMHIVIALGAEFWSMRRRMFVLEKVLEKAGISADDIEAYTATAEDKAAWAEERDRFIARSFGALTRTGGANEKQIDRSGDL